MTTPATITTALSCHGRMHAYPVGAVGCVCMTAKLAAAESALSAATQALTELGCELRDGVWMRPCKDFECPGGDNHFDEQGFHKETWLPITRPSGGEGGAG